MQIPLIAGGGRSPGFRAITTLTGASAPGYQGFFHSFRVVPENPSRLFRGIQLIEGIVETMGIHTAEPQQLAKLIDPQAESLTIYHGADPAIIFRHQLGAKLAAELSSPMAGAGKPVEVDPSIVTFEDLLHHEKPPVELLKCAKDFAKVCRGNRELLPPEVATVLYYAILSAAQVHLGLRITGLADADYIQGLQWAAAQLWVDEKTRGLIERAVDCAANS